VQADPDYLPRTQDFGLNVHLFNQKYCSKDCPKQFIAIAIACCDINPDSRLEIPTIKKVFYLWFILDLLFVYLIHGLKHLH
jgi:hypothetical protein